MSNCHLSGPLDSCSSLANLKSLSVIGLSNNNLSTTVPEFFASFSNLTALSLSHCGLYWDFPQKIFQVRTLQTLDLLSNNLLSGTLPISVGNLRKLSKINLANCSFGRTIPNSLSNLSQLAYLDFSFNNFTGSIPSLTMSKNLTQIILSTMFLQVRLNLPNGKTSWILSTLICDTIYWRVVFLCVCLHFHQFRRYNFPTNNFPVHWKDLLVLPRTYLRYLIWATTM